MDKVESSRLGCSKRMGNPVLKNLDTGKKPKVSDNFQNVTRQSRSDNNIDTIRKLLMR